jgi:hypothetical protein
MTEKGWATDIRIKEQLTEDIKASFGGKATATGSEAGGKLEALVTELWGSRLVFTAQAHIFQMEGSKITWFGADVALQSETPMSKLEFPNGVSFKGTLEVKLTASVEPDWYLVGKGLLQLGEKALELAAKYGLAEAAPYLAVGTVVGAAFIAWLGWGMYKIQEARLEGYAYGISLRFAGGYANELRELINEGRRTYTKEEIEPSVSRDEALSHLNEIYSRSKAVGGGTAGEILEFGKEAEECGKAAASSDINDWIKKYGWAQWKKTCVTYDPNEVRETIMRQALNKQVIELPIGPPK